MRTLFGCFLFAFFVVACGEEPAPYAPAKPGGDTEMIFMPEPFEGRFITGP